jgi:hypothetical protein
MKLVIRILAFGVVLSGVAAASFSSASTRIIPSHQAISAALPIPVCGPGVPTCGPSNPNGNLTSTKR